MSNSKKFSEAYLAGIRASENKIKNLSDIDNVIESLSEAISVVTDKKISVAYKLPKKNSLALTMASLAAASALGIQIDEKPKSEKPDNKAIYAINSKGSEELLTLVDIGNEGFPCTIYKDGNKLVSMDKLALEENLSELLSSAAIGDKFQRLLREIENS